MFVVDLTYDVELSSEVCADSWCYTPHGSAWYSCVPQLPSDTKSSLFTSFKFCCLQSRQTTQILDLQFEAKFTEPLFYQTTRITLHRDIYTWQQAVQRAPSFGIHTFVCNVCSWCYVFTHYLKMELAIYFGWYLRVVLTNALFITHWILVS